MWHWWPKGHTRVLLIHLVSDLRWLLKKVKERHFFFAAKTWSYSHKLKLSVQWSPFPGFAGGTTDEDSYPSSGSESRESSAGSIRSLNPIMPQHPPPSTPQLLRDARRRATKRNVLSSLVVDIPQAGEHGRGPNSARLSWGGGHAPGGNFWPDLLFCCLCSWSWLPILLMHWQREGTCPFHALTERGPLSFSCTDRERTTVLFMHCQREDTRPLYALTERGHPSFSCTDRERTTVLSSSGTDSEGTPIFFMYWQKEDTCLFHALTERGHPSFSCTDREKTHVLYLHWQKEDTHPFHVLTEDTCPFHVLTERGHPSFSCTDRERTPILFMYWQKGDTHPFHALTERGHLSFSCTNRERTPFSCTDRKRTPVLFMDWQRTPILFMYWQKGDTHPFHALTERGHLSFSCTDRERTPFSCTDRKRTPVLFMHWQREDTHPFPALTERERERKCVYWGGRGVFLVCCFCFLPPPPFIASQMLTKKQWCLPAALCQLFLFFQTQPQLSPSHFCHSVWLLLCSQVTLCHWQDVQIHSLTNQAVHSSLSAAKSSRDSGLSSGDPSPNTSQSPSAAQSPTSTVLFDQLLSARLEGAGGLRHHINRSQSSDASGLMCRAPKRLEARSSKYML